MNVSTRVHPRHTRGVRQQAEHARIAAKYLPSAREVFEIANQLRLDSRPVLKAARRVVKGPDGKRLPQPVQLPPVYGAATFRNVIEDGEWR
jgi:hypothetical protein